MFTLNSVPCVEPAILKLSLQEAGSFSWWEKYSPNHFRHQCGVDPGEGYLLVPANGLPSASFSVPLTIGNVTIPKVTILNSVDIVPTAVSPNSGTKLVHIADIRHYLKRTQVKKNYNCIRYLDSSGSQIFAETTMKDAGGGNYVSWTWETMLNDLWDNSLLSSETLNLADAEFPEVIPTNYLFETCSHRDALGRILLDLGFTLEPTTSGTWRVVGVSSDSAINSFVNSNRAIDANNIQDGKGNQLPSKLIFHFPYPEESPANKQNKTYQYEHTVSPGHSYQSVLSSSHDSIICPIQANYDFTNPTEPTNKLDLDSFASTVANRLIKLLYTSDGPDATFSTFLNVFPSADVGRVTWKNTGSNVTGNGTGAITRVEHFFPIPILPTISRPTVPLQKVSGSPTTNVTPGMPVFQLTNLKLISGVKPDQPLLVNNTHEQTYTTEDIVEAYYTYETRQWDTPKTGSAGTSLIRFELAEDKDVESLAVDAWQINPNNAAIMQEIVVIDTLARRYSGFAPRLDPQFGPQEGYRGWAQFAYTTEAEVDDEPVTKFFYHIITLEGPARWIEGTFPKVVNPSSSSTSTARSYPGKIFTYWGAYPNNRAPATYNYDLGDGEFVPVTEIHDTLNLIRSTLPAGTKYRAIYDEFLNIYVLDTIFLESTPANIIQGRLNTDLTSLMPSVEINVELFSGEDPTNGEGVLEVLNVEDTIRPALEGAETRYMFIGNEGGACQAVNLGTGWYFSYVQSPIKVPIAPE